MTEAEWLACKDPRPMLQFLCGLDGLVTRALVSLVRLQRPTLTRRTSDRKLLMFACACCRRIWHLLHDERLRQAVEVCERYADGQADERALAEVRTSIGAHGFFSSLEADDVSNVVHTLVRWEGGPICMVVGAWPAVWPSTTPDVVAEAARDALGGSWAQEERQVQCALLQDIVGNPFRTAPAIDPAWLAWHDGITQGLAEAIYEEPSPPEATLDGGRLAILADALEEAGCTKTELLAHLRSPGPHVRGCFALDAVLGKS